MKGNLSMMEDEETMEVSLTTYRTQVCFTITYFLLEYATATKESEHLHKWRNFWIKVPIWNHDVNFDCC